MPQDTLEQRAVLWTQALVRVPSVSEIKTAVKALFHLVDRLVVHPKL